jgi:hypothetical protein
MLMKTIAIPNRESSCDVNPERWVDDHRDRLFRYALLRVRRPEVATWRSWPALRRHTSTGKASPLTAVGSPDLTVVADAKPELIATQDKPAHRAMCWLMPLEATSRTTRGESVRPRCRRLPMLLSRSKSL